MYVCDNEHDLGQLKTHIEKVTKSAPSEQKGIVFRRTRPRGRVGGNGWLRSTWYRVRDYLVDVIAFPETAPPLRTSSKIQYLRKWFGTEGVTILNYGMGMKSRSTLSSTCSLFRHIKALVVIQEEMVLSR